ncbi:unnamed protein product [Sphenostylis stenocarpa]|uniref:Beta-ketoacyl synthase C-terminal domain-containing protein n=1 Tax=Sphenostylis stenocarpa TaxID=92480 RepID=A0AA86W6R5_9FABA|nr:unnamed protein product [Sphenostylis stenocarpa]
MPFIQTHPEALMWQKKITMITRNSKKWHKLQKDNSRIFSKLYSWNSNAFIEINAIKKVLKDTFDIKINATKSMMGHCLDITRGLEAIVIVKAITT